MPDIENVCIVGHGPDMIGRELGKVIDSYNLVIRMAECDWQDELDYGNQYDIGVLTTSVSKKWAIRSHRKPKLRYWIYDTQNGKDIDNYHINFNGKKALVFSKTVWDKVVKKVSRGTAALLVAIDCFNPVKIALAGFTAIKNAEFDKKHHPQKLSNYLSNKFNRKEKIDLQNTHDWQYENRLIDKINDSKNVNIRFL